MILRHTLTVLATSLTLFASCADNTEDTQTPDPTPEQMVDQSTPCGAACVHLFDCVGDMCSQEILDLVVDLPGCVADCEADPDFAPGQLSGLSCNAVNLGVCQSNPQLLAFGCACPGEENTTNAGSACTSDLDCETGVLLGGCIEETDPDTGAQSGFPGGYCTADACQGNASCGEGNFCVVTPTGGSPQNGCFGGCDPSQGRGGCREGYGCWSLTDDPTAGICFPECVGDEVCCPSDNPACGAFCDTEGTGACAL